MKTRTENKVRSHWLLLLRAFWYIVALLAVNALVISTWSAHARMVTVCIEAVCTYDRLTPVGLAALQAMGLSVHIYAAYNTVLVILIALSYIGVAAIIFWSRPRDFSALFVSLTLLMVGGFMSEHMEALRELHPLGKLSVDLMSAFGYIFFVVVCYTFPDGRFVPRWTRWPILLWAVVLIPYYIYNPEWIIEDGFAFGMALLFIGVLASCIGVQIYRYRWVSTPVQRQQSRWVTYGLLQLVAMVLVNGFAGAIWFPEMEQPGTLSNLISTLIEALSMMIVPLAIGASILRYRLWDINLIVNRTLVYVPLTTLLASLYTVVITLSQKLFVGLTGEKSDAAIVLTGFILTVTFTPLKNSLQAFVDRHFKEAPDPMKQLQGFEAQVQHVLDVIDPYRITRKLVETAIASYQAEGGALYLKRYGQLQLIYASEQWQEGDSRICLPLKDENGHQIGQIKLGGQSDGTSYNAHERRALRRTIEQVVAVLKMTDPGLSAPMPFWIAQTQQAPQVETGAVVESV